MRGGVSGKDRVLSLRLEEGGSWNLLFVLGILVGGFVASQYGGQHNVDISEATRIDLAKLQTHVDSPTR
jgi:hypothetical protein